MAGAAEPGTCSGFFNMIPILAMAGYSCDLTVPGNVDEEMESGGRKGIWIPWAIDTAGRVGEDTAYEMRSKLACMFSSCRDAVRILTRRGVVWRGKDLLNCREIGISKEGIRPLAASPLQKYGGLFCCKVGCSRASAVC